LTAKKNRAQSLYYLPINHSVITRAPAGERFQSGTNITRRLAKMATRGHPTTYTDELAQYVLSQMAEGKTMRGCRRDDPTFPSATTISRWLDAHADFRERYARARQQQAQAVAERAYDDAMSVTNADANATRLKFDAGRWLAGKLNPREYSDKTHTVLTGANDGPVQTEEMSATEIARRVAFGLARAARSEGTGQAPLDPGPATANPE
jgi:hypothetical protein